MVEFEEFRHLNEEEYRNKFDKNGDPIIIKESSGDNLVPFSVHFSNAILNDDNLNTPSMLK